jgi:hypothetical protein
MKIVMVMPTTTTMTTMPLQQELARVRKLHILLKKAEEDRYLQAAVLPS